MAEKTVMDMVTMLAVLDSARAASQDANAATRPGKWDKAAAYFIGADSGATTYGRATKRGKNYGQLNTNGEAAVNTAIIKAFNDAKNGTTAQMQTQYNNIVKQYKILYAQNTLRYANLIDKNLRTANTNGIEEIAEGQAFYRCVKPWMTTDSRKTLDEMFSTTQIANSANNFNYCFAKAALLADLGITEANLGSLDEAAGVSCASAALPTGLPKITIAAGSYTPAAPVGGSLAFSDAVNTVVGKISDASGNGAVVNAAYTDTGLKGYADTIRTGTDWIKFKNHFGSNTWMSDLIAKATDKTKIADAGARAEIIEKTVMDGIAMQVILDELYQSTQKTSVTAGRYLWDAAAAKYMGSATGAKRTIAERADKRGANYGTLEADGVTAKANKKIVDALIAGAAATTSAARTAQLGAIRKQFQVIYAQATLRYAYLVDRDIANGNAYAEHLGEGLAFYNNIAPYVKENDAAGHEVVAAFFNIDSVPDSSNYYAFCKVKAVMTKFIGFSATGELGALENTNTITCDATLPTGLSKITTDAGDYTPAADVGASLSFPIAVKKVIEDAGDVTKYPTVKTLFKDLGLAGNADMVRAGEPVYDAFKSHFGSANWMSSYFYAATDGTTLSANAAARAEIIEKTAMDAVAVNAIISDLYKGTKGTTTLHRQYWDAGAAKYLGASSSDKTVYSRADKRGKNYGTMNDGATASKANIAVLAALKAGASATTTAARTAEYDKIVTQIKVIYAQCVLRYAYLLDMDVIGGTDHAEHQAEGQAFYRVIAPWMKAADTNAHTYIEGIYDLKHAPKHTNHYCHTKSALALLKLSAADMGTLENTASINCEGREHPTDAQKFLNDIRAAAPVSSGAGKVSSAVVALASVALALVFA